MLGVEGGGAGGVGDTIATRGAWGLTGETLLTGSVPTCLARQRSVS